MSIACSSLPLLASELFDAPYSPGFFSFDAFIVVSLLCCKGVLSKAHFQIARAVLITVLLLFIVVCGWSLFFEYAFSMSLGELWGVAKFFWWGAILFVLVPIVQVAMAIYLGRSFVLKNEYPIHPVVVLISVAILLGVHFISDSLQKRQPILDFPVYEFVKQQLSSSRITQSAVLREDVKRQFSIANELQNSIKLDSIRPTVMILVESWGLRKDFLLNLNEFSVFNSNKISFKGIWRRNANFTQSAEYEDFGMPQGVKSGSTFMEKFRDADFDTWYVHGYEGKFYERNAIYDSLGFSHVKFREELSEYGLVRCTDYGFEGICDSSLAGYVDSLLTDSVPKFIYWTTLDSHPPFETQNRPDDEICADLNDVECIHAVRIRNTLRQISLLAKRHPEYRFVLRGDHRPMGSLTAKSFVTSFYHCWVPMIVLN